MGGVWAEVLEGGTGYGATPVDLDGCRAKFSCGSAWVAGRGLWERYSRGTDCCSAETPLLSGSCTVRGLSESCGTIDAEASVSSEAACEGAYDVDMTLPVHFRIDVLVGESLPDHSKRRRW